MGAVTLDWGTPVNLRTAATISSGASASLTDVDCTTGGNAAGAATVSIQVNINITSGSSTNVSVKFYGSTDGDTDDTAPIAAYTVTADDIRTTQFHNVPYVACTITEESSAGATGNVSAELIAGSWSAA